MGSKKKADGQPQSSRGKEEGKEGSKEERKESDGCDGDNGDTTVSEVVLFAADTPPAKARSEQIHHSRGSKQSNGGDADQDQDAKDDGDERGDQERGAYKAVILQEIETQQQLRDGLEESALVTFRTREDKPGVEYVSLRDFVEWWQERELRRMYYDHDSNGDGSFDLEEFSTMLDDIGIRCAPSSTAAKAPSEAGAASAASNGTQKKKQHKPSSEMTAAEVLAELDKDGTGTIDYPEFLGWWKRYDIKRLFETFDRDGSGEINFAEMMQLTVQAGVKLTKAEIRIALTDLDQDDSGALSFDEFAPWWAQLLAERKVQSTPQIGSARGLLGHDSRREEKLMNVERQDNFSRWEDDIFLDDMIKEKQDHEQVKMLHSY
jgi:calmodulin